MTEDEQVRRLLADARHTEPLPPDVADRLDGVLADLRADRPLRPTVTDLAAARRRRRARTMLLAAAAVVVVGVGIGQLDGPGTGDDAADSPTSSDAGGSAASEREQPSPADGFMSGDAAAESAPDPDSESAARVDSRTFGTRVLELRDQRAVLDRDLASGGLVTQSKARCVGRDAGAGAAVPIRYDGTPAVLVYRAPRGDTQVVDLYLCGRGEVVRSITLPAR
jgi:hypothetical protein